MNFIYSEDHLRKYLIDNEKIFFDKNFFDKQEKTSLFLLSLYFLFTNHFLFFYFNFSISENNKKEFFNNFDH